MPSIVIDATGDQCESICKINHADPRYNEDDSTTAYCLEKQGHKDPWHTNDYYMIKWRDEDKIYHEMSIMKYWMKG